MKCDSCKYLYIESANMDYPYPVSLCAKGHWEGQDGPNKGPDPWENCEDYINIGSLCPIKPKAMFKCTCVNVEPGSYDNQMVVHAPAHMPKEDGYCLDRCIAEEVMTLWQLGITTTGCCCGHGKVPPYIGVADEDIPRMKAWGYIVKPNVNPGRENDEDSFTPMGKGHALSILLKNGDRAVTG